MAQSSLNLHTGGESSTLGARYTDSPLDTNTHPPRNNPDPAKPGARANTRGRGGSPKVNPHRKLRRETESRSQQYRCKQLLHLFLLVSLQIYQGYVHAAIQLDKRGDCGKNA